LIISFLHIDIFFFPTPPAAIYALSLTTLFRSPRCCRDPRPVRPLRVWFAHCRSRHPVGERRPVAGVGETETVTGRRSPTGCLDRSEEHTSELQSRFDLVCRLLLEKKKKIYLRH